MIKETKSSYQVAYQDHPVRNIQIGRTWIQLEMFSVLRTLMMAWYEEGSRLQSFEVRWPRQW